MCACTTEKRPLTRPFHILGDYQSLTSLPPWRGKGIVMIAHKDPMDGLKGQKHIAWGIALGMVSEFVRPVGAKSFIF